MSCMRERPTRRRFRCGARRSKQHLREAQKHASFARSHTRFERTHFARTPATCILALRTRTRVPHISRVRSSRTPHVCTCTMQMSVENPTTGAAYSCCWQGVWARLVRRQGEEGLHERFGCSTQSARRRTWSTPPSRDTQVAMFHDRTIPFLISVLSADPTPHSIEYFNLGSSGGRNRAVLGKATRVPPPSPGVLAKCDTRQLALCSGRRHLFTRRDPTPTQQLCIMQCAAHS